MEDKKNLTPHPIVAKLAADPAAPLDVVQFVGYVGKSTRHDHHRLYTSLQLDDYLDIPAGAIVHHEDIPDTEMQHGGTRVWVDACATVVHETRQTTRTEARFLEGSIADEYLQDTTADPSQFALPYTPYCRTNEGACTAYSCATCFHCPQGASDDQQFGTLPPTIAASCRAPCLTIGATCLATCGPTCLPSCRPPCLTTGATCAGTCRATCAVTCIATCRATCLATCAATCRTCLQSCRVVCVATRFQTCTPGCPVTRAPQCLVTALCPIRTPACPAGTAICPVTPGCPIRGDGGEVETANPAAVEQPAFGAGYGQGYGHHDPYGGPGYGYGYWGVYPPWRR